MERSTYKNIMSGERRLQPASRVAGFSPRIMDLSIPTEEEAVFEAMKNTPDERYAVCCSA